MIEWILVLTIWFDGGRDGGKYAVIETIGGFANVSECQNAARTWHGSLEEPYVKTSRSTACFMRSGAKLKPTTPE